MVDERTPSLGLQMPHPDNRLEVDVLRLRAAITALDAACETLAGVLETKASTQEMAAAVAGLQTSITNLGTTVTFLSNTKVGVVNGQAGPAVMLSPVHLGLGPANGPSSIAVTRDARLPKPFASSAWYRAARSSQLNEPSRPGLRPKWP